MACLDDNVAAEFAEGALSANASSAVEAHLAQCKACRTLVAALAPGPGDESDLITHRRGAEPTEPAQDGSTFVVGERIGRYLVLGRIGQGGMGTVFKAYDPELDRRVAIKVLRSETGLATQDARARLIREAKSIAQLSHPNVVAVYDVGTADLGGKWVLEGKRPVPGDVYIAMEFVDGDTVTQWLRHHPRSGREIVEVFVQAAHGLIAAHAGGLLHRDFKPDNVMIGADGRVRVGDFGLARSLIGPDEPSGHAGRLGALNATLTATGTVLGTPRFMAPETLRGLPNDARSDQFSFCVALYEALWQRHPIEGESALAIVERGVRPQAPPVDRKLPAHVAAAVMRGLEPEPSKRFPSMQALIEELRPRAADGSKRRVMLGLAVVGAIGVAAAAFALRPDPRAAFDREKRALVERIEAAERDRDRLIAELKLERASKDEQARKFAELEAKNRQIEQLLSELTPPEAGGPTVAGTSPNSPSRPTRELPPLTGSSRPVNGSAGSAAAATVIARATPETAATAAVTQLRLAQDIFRGCFHEWSARNREQTATLRFSLRLTTDGRPFAAQVSGVDDSSLPICIEDALLRQNFQAAPVVLAVEGSIGFADGATQIEARAQSLGPSNTIDIQ